MHYAYTGNSGKTMDGAFSKPSRESSGHYFRSNNKLWVDLDYAKFRYRGSTHQFKNDVLFVLRRNNTGYMMTEHDNLIVVPVSPPPTFSLTRKEIYPYGFN